MSCSELYHAPREQITTVGVISAKKMMRFAKAFIKARKERSLGSVEDASAVGTTEGSGDEGQDDEVRESGQQGVYGHVLCPHARTAFLVRLWYCCVLLMLPVYTRRPSFQA